MYDAKRITEEHIEVDSKGGIKKKFAFDISDTDVIDYEAKNGVNARIFLASASDLVKLHGISDGKLFEQNVRLSLGNTKINKGLIESIKNTDEHQNFPLYHNGITILCDQFETENDDEFAVKNYVVVNGAQSITSLYSVRGSISDELKVLTKVIALKGDESLSGKITYNSNNQNAIKARDLRSNHPIQVRLQKEIQDINYQKYRYEVKRGEKTPGYKVISNEDAGLILLALDLGEPWSCHQRYRIMDDSHSRIFGRPIVNGYRILVMQELFNKTSESVGNIDDRQFATYNLTKYFLAFAVSEIMKSSKKWASIWHNSKALFNGGKLDVFIAVFSSIAETTALDLNANVQELNENGDFDYKAELKSASWCRTQSKQLVASYQKDVKRKKADALDVLLKDF